MCYLVSSLPPATSTGIRQMQMSTFDQAEGSPTALEQARAFAESQLLAGHTEVRLWKLHDEPVVQQSVIWPMTGDGA